MGHLPEIGVNDDVPVYLINQTNKLLKKIRDVH